METFRAAHGIEHVLVIPGYGPTRIFKFLLAYSSALFFRKPDSVIVVQRVHSGFIYASLLKFLVLVRRTGTVYDLDDADYLEHDPRSIHHFAMRCERVHAGSSAIAAYMRQFNPKINLVTSPVVDLGIIKQGRNQVFTVGWIGDYGGDHRKGMIEFAFPAVRACNFPLRLVLIGVRRAKDLRSIVDLFRDAPHVELDIDTGTDWQDEQRIQERIATFDVGLATLLDTPIQLAKSGIKAKQYMNNGVPVLSNDLPENNSVIEHGVNGFFFSDAEELAQLLGRFRRMADTEYERLSANARASIIAFDHSRYHQQMIQCVVPDRNA